MTFDSTSHVKVLADVTISYEESTYLRTAFTEKFNLREFTLEESMDIYHTLSNIDISPTLQQADKLSSIDDLVFLMLKEIDNEQIDPQQLIDIYSQLHI
jgi:hypothetical protein